MSDHGSTLRRRVALAIVMLLVLAAALAWFTGLGS
jgi:hypothetical protein